MYVSQLIPKYLIPVGNPATILIHQYRVFLDAEKLTGFIIQPFNFTPSVVWKVKNSFVVLHIRTMFASTHHS